MKRFITLLAIAALMIGCQKDPGAGQDTAKCSYTVKMAMTPNQTNIRTRIFCISLQKYKKILTYAKKIVPLHQILIPYRYGAGIYID